MQRKTCGFLPLDSRVLLFSLAVLPLVSLASTASAESSKAWIVEIEHKYISKIGLDSKTKFPPIPRNKIFEIPTEKSEKKCSLSEEVSDMRSVICGDINIAMGCDPDSDWPNKIRLNLRAKNKTYYLVKIDCRRAALEP